MAMPFFQHVLPDSSFLFCILFPIGAAVFILSSLGFFVRHLASPGSLPMAEFMLFQRKTNGFQWGHWGTKGLSKGLPGAPLGPLWRSVWAPLVPTGPSWASLRSFLAPQRGCRTLIRTLPGPVWVPRGRCCFQGPFGTPFWLPKGPSGHNF